MNKWIGSGRLTKEPQMSKGNTTVAKFTLAVDGYKKDDTDFIRIVAFGKVAELCETYLSKGSKVLVDGRIKTGSYENKQGQKVYTTDVIAGSVEFLEKMQKQEPKQQTNDDFDTFSQVNDDEIPF